MWERVGNALGHSRHGFGVAIRVRVNAQPVDAHLRHEPKHVGSHVPLKVVVRLVHVWHHAIEPTFIESLDVSVGAVGVKQRGAPIVGSFGFVKVSRPVIHPSAVDRMG